MPEIEKGSPRNAIAPKRLRSARPITRRGGWPMGKRSASGGARKRLASGPPAPARASNRVIGAAIAQGEEAFQAKQRALNRPGLKEWLAECDRKVDSFERAYIFDTGIRRSKV